MAFDPAYTADGLALSNNNLTATSSATDQYYRTTLSTDSPSGKIYVEVTITTSDITSCTFGLGIHGMDIGPSYDAALGGAGTLGFWSNGYSINGSWKGGVVIPYSSGDVVALALDTAGQTVQIRNVTQNSAWSSSISIAALTGPFFFGFTTFNANDTATANFSGPFAGALPPGFEGWAPAAPPSSGGWGQKVYYPGYNVFGEAGDPTGPGAFAVETYYYTHTPIKHL